MIGFSRPDLSPLESESVLEALAQLAAGGSGKSVRRCEAWLQDYFGSRALLAPSCTASLEMAALTLELGPGDEVIVPSYTFVGTAVPFARQGVRLRFADSGPSHPNLDPAHVATLVGPRTRAVVAMHYAGMACDMDALLRLTRDRGIALIEDAAHGIDAWHREHRLGTLGSLGAMSFGAQKNISSQQGGVLIVNDPTLPDRAEQVRHQGTNKAAFLRGEVPGFEWHRLGGNFVVPDLTAALLYAQLGRLGSIQSVRLAQWHRYHAALEPLQSAGHCQLPQVPPHARHNAHIYYLVLPSRSLRDGLSSHLGSQGIEAPPHYPALHASPYVASQGPPEPLPNASRFAGCLIRLPIHGHLAPAQQDLVIEAIHRFFRS